MLQDWVTETTPSFNLHANYCALLVIDMQYASACRTTGIGKLLAQRGQAEQLAYRFDRIENQVIPAISNLLRYFRARDLKVIFLTLGSERLDYTDLLPRIRTRARMIENRCGSPTHAILAELSPLPGETVLNKTSIGGFTSTPLDAVLRHMEIKHLVFTGVSSSHCVETTLRQAADLGYQCILVEDGCAEDDPTEHAATLVHVRRSYGRVETSDGVIEELEKSN